MLALTVEGPHPGGIRRRGVGDDETVEFVADDLANAGDVGAVGDVSLEDDEVVAGAVFVTEVTPLAARMFPFWSTFANAVVSSISLFACLFAIFFTVALVSALEVAPPPAIAVPARAATSASAQPNLRGRFESRREAPR